jgi:cytochrome P450
MRSPRIFILDPLMAKDILVKNFKNFRENEFSKMMDGKNDPLFSRNPFLARGEEWKERRNEISPAFSTNRMKALYPLIEDVCSRFSKFISDNIDEPLETRDLSLKFTIEAVSNCVFGIEAKSFQRSDSQLLQTAKRLTKPSGWAIVKVLLTSLAPPLKKILKVQFIDDDVNMFFMNLFNQAFDYRTNSKSTRDDYLDYLITLQKKKGFSVEDLAGHSITFFSDGMDTSSLLIAHMLYEVREF